MHPIHAPRWRRHGGIVKRLCKISLKAAESNQRVGDRMRSGLQRFTANSVGTGSELHLSTKIMATGLGNHCDLTCRPLLPGGRIAGKSALLSPELSGAGRFCLLSVGYTQPAPEMESLHTQGVKGIRTYIRSL